ncbi:putative kinesin light chain [Diplogelasinospora grovesii]|uniref:Kinesin light chain n=1 Tax=Diplogelasinospora grovesii TaxID=303347 RepID=A0AAN6N3K5_9PEZI|nr:putative kinesin light chain [Diplogelasinospora grovesii]
MPGVKDGPYRVNIIFMHGLRGHPRDRDSVDSSNKDAGTVTLRTRNILTALFKFKPSSLASISTTTLITDNETSEESLNKLREIRNEDPILFITYSLGGIIVKDVPIRRSDTCCARTKLIIFLNTPYRGNSNKKIIKTLKVNSEVLNNIYEEFKTIADHIKGLHNKVVNDFSSKLNLPRSLKTVETLDANHMQIARYSDKANPWYRAIVDVLQQFIYSIEVSSIESRVKASLAEMGGGFDGVLTNRAALPCHYIPLPENRRFVGRDKTLNTLKAILFVRKEWRKAAIISLSGVGKTQVALQLVYWIKNHRPDGGENDNLKESMRRYLSSEAAGLWLLMVDNADDRDILFSSINMPGGINEYLPESGDGLTLFTTRSREVAVSVTGSDVIKLHEMDPPEAADFFKKSLIQKDMLRDKAVPLTEYVELLHGAQQNIISLISKEFRDNTRYLGSQNVVATTWLVSFDQIRKSDNAAANLLSFISCIEPKGIPQSLFPGSESIKQLVDAIGTLCAYAFLTRRGDSKVFDMHSLVHLATRIWVQREGLTAMTDEKATRHLITVFLSNDYANRNVWREYLPHAFRVLQHSKELNIKEKSDLLVDGRIKEAVKSLEEVCQWRNSVGSHGLQCTRSN